MHNSDSIEKFASTISNLVGVLNSLSSTQDLKAVALLIQALGKLPRNVKESCALYTLKKSLNLSSLLHFNDWMVEKADARKHSKAWNQPF